MKNRLLLITAGFSSLFTLSDAQVNVFFDVFQTPASSSNINDSLAGGRQGGELATIGLITNSPDSTNDYHHQLITNGGSVHYLQLAGDGGLDPVMVSHNFDFSGTATNGQIIGKKIQFVVDAYSNNGGGQYFTYASFTLGASAPLAQSRSAGEGGSDDGFSISFVEDTFGGGGNFIQFWDGATLVQNALPTPTGTGSGFIEIFVDDPLDGDPWNGVGSTEINVVMNGDAVGVTFSKGGGGYTSNFLTFEGSSNKVGSALALHTFDDLVVQSVAVPEPSTYAAILGLFAIAGIAFRRRIR